jgi:competence protein ComEC
MKKILLFVLLALVALVGFSAYQYFHFHDGKLHIVFCDVGQGDGVLITTPKNKQILIDAGPDRKILDCLSRHMPFWDRTIEIAMLTHPHADHFAGHYYVIDRYSISQFSTERLKNKSDGFMQLEEVLKAHNFPMHFVAAGDTWRIKDGVTIKIEAPSNEFLFSKNPDGIITNSAESASLITHVSYGDFSALLTGDAPVDEMTEVAAAQFDNLDILQIPHHGSNTGIDGAVLDLLSPHLAVISVGKNNYGHPTKKTLDLLQERGIKVLRTDQRGDVEIVSDGKQTSLY